MKRNLALLLCLLCMTGLPALADDVAGATASAQSDTAEGSQGERSALAGMAEDALAAVQSDDLAAARDALQQLQREWQHATPALRRASPDEWQQSNGLIAAAAKALTDEPTDRVAAERALDALASHFNDLRGESD